MSKFELSHPQAALAVWLAFRLRGAPSEVITSTLNTCGVPRDLFILAAKLQAAEVAA